MAIFGSFALSSVSSSEERCPAGLFSEVINDDHYNRIGALRGVGALGSGAIRNTSIKDFSCPALTGRMPVGAVIKPGLERPMGKSRALPGQV